MTPRFHEDGLLTGFYWFKNLRQMFHRNKPLLTENEVEPEFKPMAGGRASSLTNNPTGHPDGGSISGYTR
jgi:hypothetical protein